MRKSSTSRVTITVGSSQDLALFFNCAINNLDVNWTVPSEANAGDRIYFMIPSILGPIQGYGTVDEKPIPSNDFGRRYRANVTDLQILEVPVRLDDLQERFPSWPYLGNAKAYTYVPSDLADDFTHFIDDYQSQPDWKVLLALESREETLDQAPEEERSGSYVDDEGDDGGEDEEWEEDEERIAVSIKRRRGQAVFRNKLRHVYNNCCAFTGYNCHHSLEAAHIKPYINSESNEISNGLLLRADIHTLFDLDLIGINNEGKIVLSELLLKTPLGEKGSYSYLDGQMAKLPVRDEHIPDLDALHDRLKRRR